MSSARRLHHTQADYVTLEQQSAVKHEYCDGEIYAMAGGTPEHAALGARVIALVSPRLPETCRVLSSDVKVRIEATDLTTYPDATIVCGALQRAPVDAHAILNPVVVFEVTSPSSEDYDRGEKLRHYKQLGSVRAIVIVAHRAHRVTVHQRVDEGWVVQERRSGEAVTVAPLASPFAVDELYAVLEGL